MIYVEAYQDGLLKTEDTELFLFIENTAEVSVVIIEFEQQMQNYTAMWATADRENIQVQSCMLQMISILYQTLI
ncbi:hypothetical protein DP148_27120 [Salmonella enterica subsp. enterica serovar Typhimurium]|nr:hypothetical protein DP148_27120 [Salmonella enterica subsp. enterica serovar Typhimurium]